LRARRAPDALRHGLAALAPRGAVQRHVARPPLVPAAAEGDDALRRGGHLLHGHEGARAPALLATRLAAGGVELALGEEAARRAAQRAVEQLAAAGDVAAFPPGQIHKEAMKHTDTTSASSEESFADTHSGTSNDGTTASSLGELPPDILNRIQGVVPTLELRRASTAFGEAFTRHSKCQHVVSVMCRLPEYQDYKSLAWSLPLSGNASSEASYDWRQGTPEVAYRYGGARLLCAQSEIPSPERCGAIFGQLYDSYYTAVRNIVRMQLRESWTFAINAFRGVELMCSMSIAWTGRNRRYSIHFKNKVETVFIGASVVFSPTDSFSDISRDIMECLCKREAPFDELLSPVQLTWEYTASTPSTDLKRYNMSITRQVANRYGTQITAESDYDTYFLTVW
jgi:hypothetical protein